MGTHNPWKCEFLAPRHPPEALHIRYQAAVYDYTRVVVYGRNNPYDSDAKVLANHWWSQYSSMSPPPLVSPEKQFDRYVAPEAQAQVPMEQLLPRYSGSLRRSQAALDTYGQRHNDPALYPWSPSHINGEREERPAPHPYIPLDFYAAQYNEPPLEPQRTPDARTHYSEQRTQDVRTHYSEQKIWAAPTTKEITQDTDAKEKRSSKSWLKKKIKIMDLMKG